MPKEVRLVPNTTFARREDMSPRGFVSVFMQEDGDMILQVCSGGSNGEIDSVAAVEFTTPMIGGGGSPRIHQALKDLAVAIAMDNLEGSSSRVPEQNCSERCVFDVPSKYPPALGKPDIANFETLRRAGQMGDLALVSAIRKADSKPVALVTAIGFHNGMYEMAPLAVMIEGDPFKDFIPPPGATEETVVKPKRRKKK